MSPAFYVNLGPIKLNKILNYLSADIEGLNLDCEFNELLFDELGINKNIYKLLINSLGSKEDQYNYSNLLKKYLSTFKNKLSETIKTVNTEKKGLFGRKKNVEQNIEVKTKQNKRGWFKR